jgi:Zn-dependent protease
MFFQMLAENPIRYFRVVVILIISITLHELAHGFAALNQGDDTPRRTGHMTLNPLVHMGWKSITFLAIAGIAWGEMPVNPAKFRSAKLGNILVSIAGPFLNLSLGILFSLLLLLSSQFKFLSIEFIYFTAKINLSLFLLNLLPIPPLDGFHVFSEMFPSLKSLNNSPIGLFAMTIIILSSDFGDAIGAIADFVIEKMTGISS